MEWMELLFTAGIISTAGWMTFLLNKKVYKEEKKYKQTKMDEENFYEFWEKVIRNSLDFKLIAHNEKTKHSVYESFYKGYRLCIEERGNKTEYWIDHKRKGMLLRNIFIERETGKVWIKYKIKNKNEIYVPYMKLQFQKVKHHWEKKEWKDNVVKATKTFYPELKEASKTSKKIDSELQDEIEKIIPFYIKMYISDEELSKTERKKYLKKIPKNIENMVKEYDQLEKKYQEKEKKNVEKYLKNIASMYTKVEKKELMEEEVFLQTRSD